ncbi:hypothetical protein TrVE_jg8540 [Triparma verrucosa]|uniref:Endonuclease/exonuclease/phosphatase domain-containing protein n=1 Tax=Triparma verrucosa TaxID=1606542 RepID=A0A9W7FGA5_9STRA|nr:hypothetical protein TrVE_jg8540 [Triparma verrucosa]
MPFKFYSQNVCCLPLFASERSLQTGSLLGAAIATLTLFFCLPTFPIFVSVFIALITTGLVFPMSYFTYLPISAILSFFANDMKHQRLEEIARRCVTVVDMKDSKIRDLTKVGVIKTSSGSDFSTCTPKYDAVILQEFYGCVYSDRSRSHFINIMKQAGYEFHSKSDNGIIQNFPSLWANSGMAIFSPHELKDERECCFSNQLAYDKFLVRRGSLTATVKYPLNSGKFKDVNVTSVHIGPPASVLTFFNWLPPWFFSLLDKFPIQISELSSEISPNNSLICGDFNAIINGSDYEIIKNSFKIYNHLTGHFENTPKTTANPLGEILLTRGLRQPKCLDYVFSSFPGSADIDVKSWACEEKAGFQFTSDHGPIVGVIDVE